MPDTAQRGDMTALPLFDAAAGSQARDAGLSLAASHKPVTLAIARMAARLVAGGRPDRTVTADDVVGWLALNGFEYELGPLAGAIFRTGEFEDTGRRLKSSRVSNHSREIRVWRLKNG